MVHRQLMTWIDYREYKYYEGFNPSCKDQPTWTTRLRIQHCRATHWYALLHVRTSTQHVVRVSHLRMVMYLVQEMGHEPCNSSGMYSRTWVLVAMALGVPCSGQRWGPRGQICSMRAQLVPRSVTWQAAQSCLSFSGRVIKFMGIFGYHISTYSDGEFCVLSSSSSSSSLDQIRLSPESLQQWPYYWLVY